jgi:hypothetical protein
VLVDRGDHRHENRRKQHDEAVEDERVREARDEPLQQLALAEDDLDFVLDSSRDVRRPVVRLGAPNLLDEELRTENRAGADDEQQRAEDDGAYERTFLSSALIAGTISCRSPITA